MKQTTISIFVLFLIGCGEGDVFYDFDGMLISGFELKEEDFKHIERTIELTEFVYESSSSNKSFDLKNKLKKHKEIQHKSVLKESDEMKKLGLARFASKKFKK